MYCVYKHKMVSFKSVITILLKMYAVLVGFILFLRQWCEVFEKVSCKYSMTLQL